MRSIVECAGFSVAKLRVDGGNEDSFEFLPKPGSLPMEWADLAAVVADGVGSSSGPRDAAVTTVNSWILHARSKFLENAGDCASFDERHFNEVTIHAFQQAHEAVQQATAGSACAAAVCLQGDRLIVGNIGDCRAYLSNKTGLHKLTEEQVDSNGNPTQVIGGKRTPEAFVSQVRVSEGDVILLSSDGLWKMVSDAEICSVAFTGSAQEISSRLHTLLMSRRTTESDDATAIVIKIKQVGKPFWETGNELGDAKLQDSIVDTKINEVIAEILNRLRPPLDKQNARAEQTLTRLALSVDELRTELELLRSQAGRIQTSKQPDKWYGIFTAVSLSLILLVGGFLIGRNLNTGNKLKTQLVKPQIPANARVVFQEYKNDRLLIRFVGRDQKERTAIYRLEDGGQPFVIIDAPVESKSDASVP